MKTFKKFDLLVSVMLIAIGMVYDCTASNGFEAVILSYFVVGGWQVISMIVHIAGKCFIYRGGARYAYNWVTFISLVTFPLGSFWILFFTAPFMALYYTWQCYDELYIKMRRPLALLK